MSTAKSKYDAHLKWLRELAIKESLPFSDVLRAVIKEQKNKYRLSDLASPDYAENRLIELGRVEFYERYIDDLTKITNSGIEKIIENRLSKMRSQASKHAADILHSKPGGSREKQKDVRAMWASGKYTSRDVCAEQECAALNMSPSAARRALRKTQDPSPWPAKQFKKN